MFVDHAEILISSGKGGDGAVTFRREPFVPNGGPDGGNGGKGGDVLFVADRNLRTLMDFKYKRKYKAPDGENGSRRNRYGKKGEDLIIKVPLGTVIYDTETGLLMADLESEGTEFIAAIGGKGGLGNSNFKNSTRQAPNFAEAGGAASERSVTLELKLIADVGLIGFPNVGKSTLLSVSSAAKPKIADYHFTTLVPNLGVVKLPDTDFVLADIPGIIEGAAEGAGLGFDFLKHIERTKVLIHVIDAAGSEGRDPLTDYRTINKELSGYSPVLAERKQIVALNKMDIADEESEALKALIAALEAEGTAYYPISAATKRGVSELLNAAAALLDQIHREEAAQIQAPDVTNRLEVTRPEDDPDYRDIRIAVDEDGVFRLTGKQLKKIFDSTNFNDYGSLRYLYNYLVKNKAIDRMKKRGLEDGDTVRIYDFEMEFTDED
ncbi:MAG: GTPase ObgE [Clostridiales Family XIII bacterium]|jgi:GTP-binding protein|nr:GTPase ObgE [Clostridiales Family XIII bacterium]